MIEIEKTFLLASMPEVKVPGVKIVQGYIETGNSDVEVRVRQKGEHYYLTKKTGTGMCREEVEVEISQEVFDILWPTTVGNRIEKVRYQVGSWEIDLFTGQFAGLVLAEIELSDVTDSIVVPECMSGIAMLDVTETFSNQKLLAAGTLKKYMANLL